MLSRKNIMNSILLTLVIVATFVASVSKAQGQQKTSGQPKVSAPKAPGENEKLDVSDLERKYWAAKDTDFNVVQNRLFNKAGRVGLTLQYGNLVNDPWTEGSLYSGSLNYYFSERYGMELIYQNADIKDNQAAQNLRVNQGGYPNHNIFKGFSGASFNWVPFYAKMSVLNSNIIYFDMAISPGAGVTTYEQQMEEGAVSKTTPTLSLDLSQHFFLSNWFALRFDWKNRWYQEDINYYYTGSVPVGGGRTVSTETNHSSMVLFGLTLYY